MSGHCCKGGRRSRRLSTRAAGLLPGAVLLILPKCPLCLTAWIAAATGAALPATLAAGVRPFLFVAFLLSAALLIRAAALQSAKRSADISGRRRALR